MNDIEQFYSDIPDPLELLTSKVALNSIIQFEKTVEIIGIVEKIENRDNLFKFVLHNNEGDKIQILAWGEEAKRIQSYVIMNCVTHIDGSFAKAKHPIYSQGNTKYDLTVMSNTIVNVLKKLGSPSQDDDENEIVQTVLIEDVMDVEGTIIVKGHLNSNFKSMVLSSGAKMGHSCLVDGEYKLEVRVQDLTSDYNKFKENQHVKITGQIYNSNIPYILVSSHENIKEISESKLSLPMLLKGTKVPKRKQSHVNNLIIKKPKIE